MSLLSQFFGFGGTGFSFKVEVAGVGGGGAGGWANVPVNRAGGGGGGGAVSYRLIDVEVGKSYSITIGAGGVSSPPSTSIPRSGGNTVFGSNLFIAGGGGGGGSAAPTAALAEGESTFGCGGGGGTVIDTSQVGDPGDGDAYGFFISDGILATNPGLRDGSGGSASGARSGGGAGGTATNIVPALPWPLGKSKKNGATLEFIGLPDTEFFAGGGGGGQDGTPPLDDPTILPGGLGGGGQGARHELRPLALGAPVTVATSGTVNTGGGGGGGGGDSPNPPFKPLGNPGGAGGSGVVFVRYPTASNAATVVGNTPTPPQAGYHVYRWNGDGSITFN